MAHYRVGEAHALGIGPDKITQYIRSNWKRPIALSLRKFYDWQFKQCPENSGNDHSIVVINQDKKIFGFFGTNERKCYIDGQPRKGAEITTWIVSEKIRGLGYGKAMVECLKRRYDVLLGAGVSSMGVVVLTKLGFKYIRYMPRYFRVFNLDAVEPISKILPLGYKLTKQYDSIPKVSHKSSRMDFSDANQFAKYLHENFNCFIRDTEHLKWRYASHPVFNYEIYRVDYKSKSAAVILKTEEKKSLKFVHVIDILSEEFVLPAVVHFLETFCKDINADFSDFYCTSSRFGHIFWYYGWFSAVDDYYIQVPHLFYPIEVRTPPTTSLIIWAKQDMCSFIDQSKLYITKGDCDLDRPTLDYFNEKEHPYDF